MTTLENSIRAHMRTEVPYVDNATNLAEATADVMNHTDWLDDETHIIWDIALEFFPVVHCGHTNDISRHDNCRVL